MIGYTNPYSQYCIQDPLYTGLSMNSPLGPQLDGYNPMMYGPQMDMFSRQPQNVPVIHTKPDGESKLVKAGVIAGTLYLLGAIASKGKFNPTKWPVHKWAKGLANSTVKVGEKIGKAFTPKPGKESFLKKNFNNFVNNWIKGTPKNAPTT